MKKILMMALVAVMAFAAQAVTLQWTKTGEFKAEAGYGDSNNSSIPRSVSLAGKVILPANVESKKNLFKVGQWNGGNLWFKVKPETTDTIQADLTGSTNLTDSTLHSGIKFDSLNNKTLYFFATYEKLEGNNVKATWYINDQLVAEHTYTGETANKLNGLEISTLGSDWVEGPYRNNEFSAYDGVLTKADRDWLMKNGTTVVPEPTVLALLALGVAGLALKRKVA